MNSRVMAGSTGVSSANPSTCSRRGAVPQHIGEGSGVFNAHGKESCWKIAGVGMHGVDFVDTGGAQKTGGVDFMAAEIVTELLAGCDCLGEIRS